VRERAFRRHKNTTPLRRIAAVPVMAKARIGHFVEAQVLQVRAAQYPRACLTQRTLPLTCLQALEVDYIDESEVR